MPLQMKSPDYGQLLKKALISYKPRSFWQRQLLDLGRGCFFVLFGFAVIWAIGKADLLDWSLIVSLFIAEIPIGYVVANLLGEGRQTRIQRGLDALDVLNANIRFAHLTVFKVDNWEDYEYPRLQYFIANMKTNLAFRAEQWIDDLLSATIITHHFEFKNKEELIASLQTREIKLIERYPTYNELGLA